MDEVGDIIWYSFLRHISLFILDYTLYNMELVMIHESKLQIAFIHPRVPRLPEANLISSIELQFLTCNVFIEWFV